jgi:hypothetical protein
MFKSFVFIVVAGLVGCGGGGGVSVENLPDEIAGAQCDRLVACDGVVDRATCDAAVALDPGSYGSIEAGVKDGSIKYDSGKAAACADSLGDTSCKFPGFHQDDPCEDVFKGTVLTGGACVIDLQCAGGGECVANDLNCDTDIACCPGKCAGMSGESALGGPCDDDIHFCAFDAYCKSSGTSAGVCTALVTGEGTTCDAIDACANPMYCNINFSTNMGTCKTPAASGATCSRMDLIPCVDTRDHCDATMLKCVRDVAVGGACGTTGVQCVGYSSCVNNVCVADIPLNGACQVDTGADCVGSLECISGKCVLPPPGLTCMLP